MIEAFKKMIDNWKDFEGRTSRPDYWWATLAWFIISVILSIIIIIPFAIAAAMDKGAGIFIDSAFYLQLLQVFFPSLSRLPDSR